MKRARAISGVTDLETVTFRLRRDAVCWRQESRGVLVYDIERDVVYNGNSTALQVIERCYGRHTVGEIADCLVARYGIPRSQALADVTGIIRQMVEWEIIERAV